MREFLFTLASFITLIFSYNDLNSIFKKIRKQILNPKDPEALSTKMRELTDSLKKSTELMANIEEEFAKQKDIILKLKEEAETERVIASLSREEVEAVNRIFSKTVKTEGKKSNSLAFIYGAIFCVIGLIGGVILQTFTNILK